MSVRTWGWIYGETEETYGSRDEPVNVPDVEDLARETGDLGAVALELHGDRGVA